VVSFYIFWITKNKNQRILLIAAMLALLLTMIVTFGVTPLFTHVVNNDGVEEEEEDEDDTTNGDSVIVMDHIL
jgi:hypothetical protein